MAPGPHDGVSLDEVDRGILLELQRDARNTTNVEIADAVGVSPSTVRNRIDRLQEEDVIQGYVPRLNYEAANMPLRVLFVCSADSQERSALARAAKEIPGVITVMETLTSERNVHVEAVGTSTAGVASITEQLTEAGLDVVTSEIVTNQYVEPLDMLD